MITLIENIRKTGNEVFVRAVIEDMVLLYHQTNVDPPEYGPALCEASFELNDDVVLSENEDELIEYLNSLSLDWKVLTDDWDY